MGFPCLSLLFFVVLELFSTSSLLLFSTCAIFFWNENELIRRLCCFQRRIHSACTLYVNCRQYYSSVTFQRNGTHKQMMNYLTESTWHSRPKSRSNQSNTSHHGMVNIHVKSVRCSFLTLSCYRQFQPIITHLVFIINQIIWWMSLHPRFQLGKHLSSSSQNGRGDIFSGSFFF